MGGPPSKNTSPLPEKNKKTKSVTPAVLKFLTLQPARPPYSLNFVLPLPTGNKKNISEANPQTSHLT